MPEDKAVEERHQTQHKLELMERYWGAWCTILAQTGLLLGALQEEDAGLAKPDVVERALALVAETRELVESLVPERVYLSRFTGPLVYIVLVRCLSRFTAIEALIREGLTDEATILLRPLTNDSMRLRFLDRHPETRDANALSWWSDQLSQIDKLAKAAGPAKQPWGPELLEVVKHHRRDVEEKRKRLGVKRLLPMPGEGRPLALALGTPEDQMDYLLSTFPSHSTLSSMAAFNMEDAGGDRGIHVRTPDPEDVAVVADRACKQFIRAAIAAFHIFEWEGVEALDAQFARVVDEFWVLLGHIWDEAPPG